MTFCHFKVKFWLNLMLFRKGNFLEYARSRIIGAKEALPKLVKSEKCHWSKKISPKDSFLKCSSTFILCLRILVPRYLLTVYLEAVAFNFEILRTFKYFLSYHPIPWRDSISRLIAPVSSRAGGDDTTRPRLQSLFLDSPLGANFYPQRRRCPPGVTFVP
jgi:hypothetical protein